MTRQEYSSIIGRLPIKKPTAQDMAMLCPHLTEKEAVKAFMADGDGYVACPPLRIRHGFQILSYQKEWVEEVRVRRINDGNQDAEVIGRKNHPSQVRWSYTGRTRKSYADGEWHGDSTSPRYKHMDKAAAFADTNWGDELILDDWKSVVEFYVQDPTDLVSDQYHKDYPRTKAVLYVTLDRDLNDIINDHTRPHSEHFDAAILQMTLDIKVWHELQGGRGRHIEFSCANCGAGLDLSGCSGCGYRFRDDHFRCGWDTPLSPKMIGFLRQNGHEFRVDPMIALAKERQNWEHIPVEHRKKNQLSSEK